MRAFNFGFDLLGMYNEERVASGRGLTSLANEPSMFGFILNLLMASILIAREETKLDWLYYWDAIVWFCISIDM